MCGLVVCKMQLVGKYAQAAVPVLARKFKFLPRCLLGKCLAPIVVGAQQVWSAAEDRREGKPRKAGDEGMYFLLCLIFLGGDYRA